MEEDRYILVIGRGLKNSRQGLKKGQNQLANTKTITFGDLGLKHIKTQHEEEEEEPGLTEQEKTYLYQKYNSSIPSRRYFDSVLYDSIKNKNITKTEATEIMRDMIYTKKHPHISQAKRDRTKNKYHYPIQFKDK